jgi:thiol-disulfide isomerase/thioredoxin
VASEQESGRQALDRGRALWEQRLSKSAIAALEIASRDRASSAEALEALGRLYAFKGWRQENIFPGWHDEPAYRERALETLKAAVKADSSRASAQDALAEAEKFAASEQVEPAVPRPPIVALDAKIDAFRSTPQAPIADLLAAVDARAAAQADPAPLFAGAQILIDRGEYDRAIAMAERGRTVSDRFIDENASAYQMSGKLQGSYTRGRATASDLAGWALFNKKDLVGAAARLEEAERLYQGQDFANQYHLGELARVLDDRDAARRHYLNGLALTGGAAPLRTRATEALRGMHAADSSIAFDAWLETELARRREERRVAALKSLVDRPLPRLPLTSLEGRPYDMRSVQGKVLLLNFFASWCGICRAELPQLKAAYAKYQSDPSVAFLLVSIDQDPKRLQRFVSEMKFPFPVARLAIGEAELAMNFDNVPSTFYVDRDGIVRYQIGGVESHGDSPTRVSWFIEQLRTAPR